MDIQKIWLACGRVEAGLYVQQSATDQNSIQSDMKSKYTPVILEVIYNSDTGESSCKTLKSPKI